MANFSFCKDVKILENTHVMLREVNEIKAIANVEDPILSGEWCLINDYVNNQFISSSNEVGISRYEKMLGLKVSDTDTLDARIFRVLARFQEQAPYTWKSLHRILDTLLGEGNYVLTRNVATKVIDLKVELSVKSEFDTVVDLMERIVPMNMIINVSLRYNTYAKLAEFTHAELSAYTHEQLREDVLI